MPWGLAKRHVREAYKQAQANHGAARGDRQSIAAFEGAWEHTCQRCLRKGLHLEKSP